MKKLLFTVVYLTILVNLSFGQKIPKSPNDIKINDLSSVDSLTYIETLKVNSKKHNAVFIGIESDNNDLIQRFRELVYILRKSSYTKIGIAKRKANDKNSSFLFTINGELFGPSEIDKEESESYVKTTYLHYFIIDKIVKEYEKEFNKISDTVYIKKQSEKIREKYKVYSKEHLTKKRDSLIRVKEKQTKEKDDAVKTSIALKALALKLNDRQEFIKILNKYGLNNSLENIRKVNFDKISKSDMNKLNSLIKNIN